MSRDNDYFLEEDFHNQDRKHFRKMRKQASKQDRSKYKKTDRDKRKKEEEAAAHLIQGRVLAIRAEGIYVSSEPTPILCSLRGSLKLETSQLKNLIAVGDFVLFEKNKDQGVISEILERRSILSRADNLSRKKQQIIATNIDQVLITSSVLSPALKSPLIDRYIIAAKKGNMTPILIFNKIDLLDAPSDLYSKEQIKEEKALLKELLSIYKKLKIETVLLSTKTKEGIDKLLQLMHGKTSVFSGQSGVGKTSLINEALSTDLEVGGVVERTRKGSHTTSATTLIPVPGGGFCLDTPGIRSFGIWDLSLDELQNYFDEIKEEAKGCFYPDCKHLMEPSCKVKEAVEKGKISSLRFDSYCALMASLSEEHRKR